jgi:hypothetical protein
METTARSARARRTEMHVTKYATMIPRVVVMAGAILKTVHASARMTLQGMTVEAVSVGQKHPNVQARVMPSQPALGMEGEQPYAHAQMHSTNFKL